MSDDLSFQESLRAIRRDWRLRANAELARLAGGLDAATADTHDRAWAVDLQRFAHQLAGSGETFGAPEVSTTARTLDLATRRLFGDGYALRADDPHRALSNAETNALGEALGALARALDDAADVAIEPVPEPEEDAGPERRSVFVVDDDAALAVDLSTQLRHFGYRVRTFSDIESFRRAVEAAPPAVVVIDLAFPDGPEAGADAATTIDALKTGRVPVLFISARADFAAKLRAVRAGARGYFTKPLNVAGVVDAIEGVANPDRVSPLRVLLIDDDRLLTELYSLALRNAGMTVVAVHGPVEALASIAETRPDVILLDLYLEDCSGAEVAAVLRTDPANLGIPILFMSGEGNRDKQIEVLASGADDFLEKPIPAERLVRELVARTPRIRALQGHLSQDGLTGLLNHVAVRGELVREVAHARRDRHPLAVAMIDLDNFKSVNDRYGHLVGDRVLRSLARMLRRRLRRSDLVGRYGGEEFVVLMPGSNAATAGAAVDALRIAFSKLRHAGGSGEFQCTFSAGIASFPDVHGAGQLIDVADRSLYVAKRNGRNRVEVAGQGQ